MKLTLASASPARLATLRAAGIKPRVMVPDADEDAILAGFAPSTPAPERVLLLARAKAHAVETSTAPAAGETGPVVACDSMLEIDGELVGKPLTTEAAIARWQKMRGGHGLLHTGHWVTHRGRHAGKTSTTKVVFANPTDREIEAYCATGEPQKVAGAFTIDGLGGWFIESIEGCHHGVVGISLPLLRTLLTQVGVNVTDLWQTQTNH